MHNDSMKRMISKLYSVKSVALQLVEHLYNLTTAVPFKPSLCSSGKLAPMCVHRVEGFLCPPLFWLNCLAVNRQ